MIFDRGYAKRILHISLPIILSNLVAQLQMLIDRIFLGRLDIINMTAVGNATTPIWVTISFLFSLTIGSTILISQAVGKGDREAAYMQTCSLFKYNTFIGFILFLVWILFPRVIFRLMKVPEAAFDLAVCYAKYYSPVFLLTGVGASIDSLLQTSERTKALFASSVVRSGLNIVLDWILIFGKAGFPAMGVKGAAIATTIAEYAGGVVLLILVLRDKKLVTLPKFRDILPARFRPFLNAVKLGIPTALEDFAWNIGNLMITVFLNLISDTAAGIYTIIFSVELLPLVAISGIGQGSLTLSGQEKGRSSVSKIMDVVKTALICCFIVSLAALLLFILFPQFVLGLFTTDKTILASAGIYLAIIGIDLFPKSGNIVIGSGIRGYGNTGWMLLTQIFGTIFVISLSAIMVMVFHTGLIPLLIVVVADELLRSIANYLRLRHLTSGSSDGRSAWD